MAKVEVELTNVYYGDDGQPVDKIGQTVKLEADKAEALVNGGAAVFATKSDATAAGVPDAATRRQK